MEPSSAAHRVISRQTALRWVLLVAVACAAAVAVLLNLAQRYVRTLQFLAQEDPARATAQALSAIQFVLFSATLLSFAIGCYLVWYGHRAAQTGFFPPAGAWVLEGKAVHTGRKASALAWLYIALGLLVVGAGCALAYYAWVAVPALFGPAGSNGA